MSSYEVAFSGELVADTPIEQVQTNLAKIFNLDAQRVMLLFTGRRIVLRSNLSQAEADKYQKVLYNAGALVEVCEQMQTNSPNKTTSTAATATAVASLATPTPTAATKSQLSLAAPGDDLPTLTATASTPVPAIDISHLSLAPVGAPLEEIPASKSVIELAVPDISHLSVVKEED